MRWLRTRADRLSGEVNALAVHFEEAAVALRAAIHPDRLADEGEGQDAADDTKEPAADDPEAPPHTDRV